eukprot:2203229-Rhodomonas_salina.6
MSATNLAVIWLHACALGCLTPTWPILLPVPASATRVVLSKELVCLRSCGAVRGTETAYGFTRTLP